MVESAALGIVPIVCISVFVGILFLACLVYCCYRKRRDKKKKPPGKRKRRQPNVISHLHGSENFAGPQHRDRGITVTASSGVHYTQQQPPPGPANLQHTQLPPYPAPTNGHAYIQANGHANNGFQAQVAQPQPASLLQQQRAFVPMRVESPMGVSSNPMGRSGGSRLAPGSGGSMDTLNTTDDTSSVLSFGSTGSYSSAASINNPMRSSLKRPKNKETASVASGMSKKSVRIALGEEQTAV